MIVSSVFLLLLTYTAGNLWYTGLPKESTVLGTRLEGLAPVIRFLNPGPFGLKEVGMFD